MQYWNRRYLLGGVIFAVSIGWVLSTAGANVPQDEPVLVDQFVKEEGIKVDIDSTKDWKPRFKGFIFFSKLNESDLLTVQNYKGVGKRAKKWGKPIKCKIQRGDPGRFKCEGGDDLKLKKGGKFEARFTYKSGAAGKTWKDFRTLPYKVIRYMRFYHKKKANQQYGFVIDKDFRVGETWLVQERRAYETSPSFGAIMTWLKYKGDDPSKPSLVCKNNGKQVLEVKGRLRSGRSYSIDSKKGDRKVGWGAYAFEPIAIRPATQNNQVRGAYPLFANPG
ncbi:MAG: hypothetical protein ACPGUV_13665, partial [Polyangiales bacterium]